jgi:RNA polymerase sigma-70 factor (ECF subfamily)
MTSGMTASYGERLDSGARTGPSLAHRLREGEVAAVGEAYELHHEAVRGFAQRLVGDRDAAEDLVHETFVSLPRAMKGFREESTLRTFLISIAVNHSRHYVRAAARRRAAMERAALEPRGSSSTPEQKLEQRQLAAALTRALDSLSMDHRVTFVLCAVEDRSSIEAAEILAIPEGTVRTRLHHAKKKLRDALAKEGVK